MEQATKKTFHICFRCSAAFFEEERAALENRRYKIRLLQQRKMSELTSYKDLPEEIPMHLVIGTKVTGKNNKPQFQYCVFLAAVHGTCNLII